MFVSPYGNPQETFRLNENLVRPSGTLSRCHMQILLKFKLGLLI